MSIEVANESGAVVDEAALAALARHVLGQLGVNPLAELSILLVEPSYMAQLNQKWLGEAGPTDVLAFPMDELDADRGPGIEPGGSPQTLVGDVVLCPEVAAEQGRRAGHSTEDELHLLCTHGVLHLLGYDHAEEEQEREMFRLQEQLLTSWRRARAAVRTTGRPAGG